MALRQRLWLVLLVRMVLVEAYLAAVALLIAVVSLIGSPHAVSFAGGATWVMETFLIADASAMFLLALALLTTHLSASAVSGYLVAVAYWLASLMGGLILPPTSGVRPYLLFGWTFPMASDQHAWILGKLVLLGTAVVMLALEIPLLRHESRLIRGSRD
ncbi:MAG TPA: hypothetical protein VIC85_14625 [Ktedonobacterales bacterium]